MIQRTLIILLTFITISLEAQIPPNYYFFAEGQTGQQLRLALKVIIDDHDVQTYADLWNHFIDTDSKENGNVWDMYSDIPDGTPDYSYIFGSDQCGNYSQEGDCYNREHSFPKSWFGDVPPMDTDLFHLIPSDGYVNGQRSNYPYGEVSTATWTSTNGSKRGACSYPGYTGTVFEPIDEYKGDLARGYFYMLTRYMNDIDTWNSPMLTDDDFSDWAKNLLLDWAAEDTVSDKEIDRNNEIYLIQGNRNPFIDHPEYITEIWGSTSSIDIVEVTPPKAWYNDNNLHLSNISSGISSFRIYSISGRLLFESRLDDNRDVIPLSLVDGMYIIDFIGKNSRASVKLVALNK